MSASSSSSSSSSSSPSPIASSVLSVTSSGRGRWEDQPLSIVSSSSSSSSTACLPSSSSSSTPTATRRSGGIPLSACVEDCMTKWSYEYLQEASRGDSVAMYLVAQMYLAGWGAFTQDFVECKRWLNAAASAGSGEASALLRQLAASSAALAASSSSHPSSSNAGTPNNVSPPSLVRDLSASSTAAAAAMRPSSPTPSGPLPASSTTTTWPSAQRAHSNSVSSVPSSYYCSPTVSACNTPRTSFYGGVPPAAAANGAYGARSVRALTNPAEELVDEEDDLLDIDITCAPNRGDRVRYSVSMSSVHDGGLAHQLAASTMTIPSVALESMEASFDTAGVTPRDARSRASTQFKQVAVGSSSHRHNSNSTSTKKHKLSGQGQGQGREMSPDGVVPVVNSSHCGPKCVIL